MSIAYPEVAGLSEEDVNQWIEGPSLESQFVNDLFPPRQHRPPPPRQGSGIIFSSLVPQNVAQAPFTQSLAGPKTMDASLGPSGIASSGTNTPAKQYCQSSQLTFIESSQQSLDQNLALNGPEIFTTPLMQIPNNMNINSCDANEASTNAPTSVALDDSDSTNDSETAQTVTIDYLLYIVGDLDWSGESAAVKAKAKSEVGKVMPRPGHPLPTIKECLIKLSLDQFKEKVIDELINNRKLAGEEARDCEKHGKLQWHVYIMSDRKFGKSANVLLKSEPDYRSFALAAQSAGEKAIGCRVWMDDLKVKSKKSDEQEHADTLLKMKRGSMDERQKCAQQTLRRAINPKANQGGMPLALQKLNERCQRMGAQWGTEKRIFVNPNDPNQFFVLDNHRAFAWAQAIDLGEPGIDLEHPPKTAEFKYLPREALHGNPARKRQSSQSLPESQQKRGCSVDSSTEGNNHPIPETPNLIDDFLHFMHLDQDSEAFLHVKTLLQEHAIHHWLFFRHTSTNDLKALGFKPGPAVLIPIFVEEYERKWRLECLTKNRQDF